MVPLAAGPRFVIKHREARPMRRLSCKLTTERFQINTMPLLKCRFSDAMLFLMVMGA
jgi:hypothetical protein